MLPSGVDSESFLLRVIHSETITELAVKWQIPLIDLEPLHENLLFGDDLCYRVYHFEYAGLQQTLRQFRTKSADRAKSGASLALPFSVETYIYEKHNLAWCDNSTKLLYTRLKAAVGTHAVHHDNDKLDLVQCSLMK